MSSYADVTLGSLCLATSRNGFDPTLMWLPGKQQRIGKEFWVQGQVKVSEDYVTAAIDGQPVKANSVYDAIVFEQVLRYPTASPEERLAIIKPLREVRSLRQKPAHKVEQDTYDRQFYALQDELVWKVYEALRDLRCLLATDSSVSSYEPPFWVREFSVKGY